MFGRISFGHLSGVGQFVERYFPESDRRRIDGTIRQICHHGNDRAGIDPAAEKSPQRHFAFHPDGHGILQNVVELFERHCLLHVRICLELRFPVSFPVDFPFLVYEIGSRLQLENAPENRIGRRNVQERKVIADTFRGDFSRYVRVRQNRLQLGGKNKTPVVEAVIQWFFP